MSIKVRRCDPFVSHRTLKLRFLALFINERMTMRSLETLLPQLTVQQPAARMRLTLAFYSESVPTGSMRLHARTYRVSCIVLQKLNDVFFGQIVTFELLFAPLPCWFRRHFGDDKRTLTYVTNILEFTFFFLLLKGKRTKKCGKGEYFFFLNLITYWAYELI